MQTDNIAILGVGNIGGALARGLHSSQVFAPEKIYLTRRNLEFLKEFQTKNFNITSNNLEAVEKSRYVFLAVTPRDVPLILKEIAPALDPEQHIVTSLVAGVELVKMKQFLQPTGAAPILRAMPNTAVAIRQSMTCLACDPEDQAALLEVQKIFNYLGKTLIIEEKLIDSSTALCACGVAFFLRAIRAAAQGGVEIGFHAEQSIQMAAQTAKGSAELLLTNLSHPEEEIDRVTTPRGITISGLNEMEHQGFSSAFIRGINTSASKAKEKK